MQAPLSPPAEPAPSNARWFPAARLLRPQGRRGELLAEPLTDRSEVFTPGQQFRLVPSTHAPETAPACTLESCWRPHGRNAGRLVLKLAGIDSITAAEALGGNHQLFLPEADLPALDPDTFFVRDLLGCALYDGDHLLGSITALEFPIAADGRTRLPDAADLLAIQPPDAPPGADPLLIPFVKAWLSAVDLPGKRITMHLPSGLFDHGAP